MKYALGIIETIGLAAGIQAADAAVKSANVKLVGYELSKGDGMATIKIEGDVGAVKAGIEAARAAAGLVNKVYASKVIARPSDGIEMLIRNSDTVGYEKASIPPKKEIPVEVITPIEAEAAEEVASEDKGLEETKASTIKVEEKPKQEKVKPAPSEDKAPQEAQTSEDVINDDEVCNICKDPKCTRKKGDLRRFCIHYYDDK